MDIFLGISYSSWFLYKHLKLIRQMGTCPLLSNSITIDLVQYLILFHPEYSDQDCDQFMGAFV